MACEEVFKVVMVRHGQSEWSQRFCGWYNANLTEKGLKEAEKTAQILKNHHFQFDAAYTSALNRASDTLNIILKELNMQKIPVMKSWKLNERHYGALTGLDKVETADKYGEKLVQTWRRSYNLPPPPIEESHAYFKDIRNDPIYASLTESDFPNVESLESTIKRALPFWHEEIAPKIKQGEKVLIVAHGTSLRGLIKHLDGISDENIRTLDIPTGIPFVYTLDGNLKPVKSLEFLEDPEVVKKAMEDVKNQIKKKI